jgi:hypothetical protein
MVNGSNNISSADPMFGALADNGGPTNTTTRVVTDPMVRAFTG